MRSLMKTQLQLFSTQTVGFKIFSNLLQKVREDALWRKSTSQQVPHHKGRYNQDKHIARSQKEAARFDRMVCWDKTNQLTGDIKENYLVIIISYPAWSEYK